MHPTPVHRDLVVRCQTVVDFLEGGKTAPGLQLGHVLNLCVCLEQHQIVLGHYQVDVDHVLPHLPRLFTLLRQLQFYFLLAWEHSTVSITEPDEHIVVKTQMEAPQFSNLVLLAFSSHLNDPRNEKWNLLNNVVQVHGGTPLSLIIWQQVPQQVSPIRQRRVAKSSFRHYYGRLEGKLVPQQNIEVERLYTLLHLQCTLCDFKLHTYANKKHSHSLMHPLSQ